MMTSRVRGFAKEIRVRAVGGGGVWNIRWGIMGGIIVIGRW